MGNRFKLLAVASIAMMAACGEKPAEKGTEQPPVPTAATLGEQEVLGAAEYLAQARYAGADQANGERQAQICRACHRFDEGGAIAKAS